MTYPLKFRQKVLSVRESEGLTLQQTAERFCVGIASLTRWIREIEPKETRNKPATKIDMEALKKDIEERPDSYNYERAQRFGVSASAIRMALIRLKISYKKNSKSPQSGSRCQREIRKKN